MEDKEKQMLDTYFHKDEFGNYVISEFEDLGFDLDFEELLINIIGNHIEYLQKELSKSNEKLKKIEEYCKDNNEYMGSDSYINGLNEGNREVKNDILSIIKGDE